MIRNKLTETQFQLIKPGLKLLESMETGVLKKHGQINLLISGTVDPCTGLTTTSSNYSIVGATINYTSYNIQGKSINNRDALKQCTQFSVQLPNLETEKNDYYLVDILGKKVFVDYIYFKCNTPISASNISFGEKTVIEIELSEDWNLAECREDSTSADIETKGRWSYDYKAALPVFVDIQYFPYYTSDYFKDDYNPLINNASTGRTGSAAVNIGLLSESRGFFNRQGMGKADIPDYWYTSVGMGLGRYLGTKCTRNLICSPYVGFKKSFTDSYLTASKANNYEETVNVSGSLVKKQKHRSIDRPFYNVQTFTGSIFSSGSVAEVTGSIRDSDTKLEELRYVADSKYAERRDGNGLKVWEEVGKLNSLPKVGDVLYKFDDSENVRYRLTNSMIYIPEAGQLLCTDDYGVVFTYYTVD